MFDRANHDADRLADVLPKLPRKPDFDFEFGKVNYARVIAWKNTKGRVGILHFENGVLIQKSIWSQRDFFHWLDQRGYDHQLELAFTEEEIKTLRDENDNEFIEAMQESERRIKAKEKDSMEIMTEEERKKAKEELWD